MVQIRRQGTRKVKESFLDITMERCRCICTLYSSSLLGPFSLLAFSIESNILSGYFALEGSPLNDGNKRTRHIAKEAFAAYEVCN